MGYNDYYYDEYAEELHKKYQERIEQARLERERKERLYYQREDITNTFMSNDIILINLLASIQKCLPINCRNYDISFTIDNNLKIPDINVYDFLKLYSILDKNQLFTNIKILKLLNECGIYNEFKLNIQFSNRSFNRIINNIEDIYYITINDITVKCKKCGLETKIDPWSNIEKYTSNNTDFCCKTANDTFVKRFTHGSKEDKFKSKKEYFEKHSINKGKFILKDLYTIQCRHNHITRLKKYMSIYDMNKPTTCWICENRIEKKYELFKLLKELGVKYYIKELDTYNTLPGLSTELRHISRVAIFTYNDKKYLTGKIVFSDPNGENQARANSNKLVFRWFEMKYINDAEYCKAFLYSFFNDIVKKNKLVK